MHIVRVLFNVKSESVSQVRAYVREHAAEGASFPGNVTYAFRQDPEEPRRWLLFEEWEDESAFDAYKRSEHFAAASRALGPLMDGPPATAYYRGERVGP